MRQEEQVDLFIGLLFQNSSKPVGWLTRSPHGSSLWELYFAFYLCSLNTAKNICWVLHMPLTDFAARCVRRDKLSCAKVLLKFWNMTR